MPDLFDAAFQITVGHEGSTLDLTQSDRGNWTGGRIGVGKLVGSKFGISAAAYPTLDIAALTLADAEAIYRRDYWARARCAELPATHGALAIALFDSAVNNGVPSAIRLLQIAVDARPVDLLFGDETMAAVTASDPLGCLLEFSAQRLYYEAGMAAWREDALGWSRRLVSVPVEAINAFNAYRASVPTT